MTCDVAVRYSNLTQLRDTENLDRDRLFCVFLALFPLEEAIVSRESRTPSRRDTACCATEDMTSEEQQVIFCFASLPVKWLQ